MKNNEFTFENSPFFVEYTGETKYKKNGETKYTKTYGYHVRRDFEKPLKEFFDARFGGLSDGAIMEQIVYDHYFRYAHERNYCGKTIVALIHEKQLASANPDLIPLLVLDRFVKDNENGVLIDDEMINNYEIMEYIGFAELFKDVNADLKKDMVDIIYNDGFAMNGFDVFQDMKDFNENTLKNFFVLEIPLNNFLDAELNGVYCYENDDGGAVESMHVGVAIVKDNEKHIKANPIPIIYAWSLENDFKIKIHVISRIDLDELHKLAIKYNQTIFTALKFFEIANFGDEYKLKENRQKQAKLQDELELLKQQEKLILENMNDESID